VRDWGSSHRTTGLLRSCASFLLAAVLAACASAVKEPGPPPPVPLPPSAVVVPLAAPAPDQIYRETGLASWYGKEFHGRKTASGEVFDMYALTAAHRTLPVGTVIRVTNLDNFKSVKVTINDRGPFVKNWVLDL
jgi:rare lipoprotein A